jgi:D-alanine transaminase
MSRVAYVDGRYVPHGRATTHIEDRGYQFADGVYEVIAISGGRMVDAEGHLVRLHRSLNELRIDWRMSDRALVAILQELIRLNGVTDGSVYLQITRGVARRDHPFPKAARPVLVATAKRMDFNAVAERQAKGVAVITQPDIRWGRCDIKTVGLLPNVLAKQAAREKGAYEAWLVDEDGNVTEGSSTNAWIVDKDGNLITRKADNAILNGITRLAVKQQASERQIKVIERPFTIAEAKAAREAFITSTTSFVMPVTSIDGTPIGDGKPGKVASGLIDAYREHMAA